MKKAEADLATARRESRVEIQPNHDAVAFHSQQAAEKFIKAVLCERDNEFPRSHDLLKLAMLIQPRLEALVHMQDALEVLSQGAVEAIPGITLIQTRRQTRCESPLRSESSAEAPSNKRSPQS